jgi:hypothetical protein
MSQREYRFHTTNPGHCSVYLTLQTNKSSLINEEITKNKARSGDLKNEIR